MTTPSYQDLDAPLGFTPAAAAKVAALIADEGNAELKLRVYITGGGCSGFQYGFEFDEASNEDDVAGLPPAPLLDASAAEDSTCTSCPVTAAPAAISMTA